MRTPRSSLGALVLGLVTGTPISAQVTQRVSLGSGAVQGAAGSAVSSLSPDGRYVAFSSLADDLVPGDTNGKEDVFVRDRATGVTERVNVDSAGLPADLESFGGWLSADARFVAFTSRATNLVPGDTNANWDGFVRDRIAGTTERVSVSTAGAQGNNISGAGPITPDGRYVVLVSFATNLAPIATTGQQVLVRDRQSGTTELVSVDSAGTPGNHWSYGGAISADGRFVAFVSRATNLVPGDTNGTRDVFVHDRRSGTTDRVSVGAGGAQGNGECSDVSITPDGRLVAFVSDSIGLVPEDTNLLLDVFLHDREAATTERVSLDSWGAEADGESSSTSISADGRYVGFTSAATNLTLGDTNGSPDVFVRDRVYGTTERASVASSGLQAAGGSAGTCLSADGRFVAFTSSARNLVAGDTNGSDDVFVRTRIGGTSFTSLCDPGLGGVAPCPCSNAPSWSGRGCDNSAGTGGAGLYALGGAILSSDSLVLATNAQVPGALSLVLQGSSPLATGAVYGQGVRCVGGTMTRLYAALAPGGSLAVPDLAAGDPPVSVRSAAKGDVIQPGQSRWYVVGYRDPSVRGGCPAASTFNATQTGLVSWSP